VQVGFEMTSRQNDRDKQANRDEAAARTYWLTEQLGEQWRSEGNGVYRFVGSADSPPVEAEEELRDAHAPLTRDPSGPVEPRPTKQPRPSRLPWRRR
jgi:hypothetical protein